MKTKSFAAAAILVGLAALALAAEHDVVSGVITNVDAERGTVTILNERTGQRRTYFVTDNTRMTSRDRQIAMQDLKRGMTATARYQETDTGREVGLVEIPDMTGIQDIAAPGAAMVETISGEVTGVRRDMRTVTILEDRTRMRRTLTVSDDTRIMRRGNLIGLEGIRRGDQLTARYRMSDAGPVLVSAAEPTPAPQTVAAAQPAELPKTAGSLFWPLIAGAGMLFAAAVLRIIRALGYSKR